MSRRLSFLLVTTFYPPYSFGGDGVYVYRLAHALGDAGHQVTVVHCLDAYHLLHRDPPPFDVVDHPNVVRHGLRSGLGWVSPLMTHQTGRPALKSAQLSRIFAATRYDVVHYHNISLFGPGVLALGDAAAVRLYTTHDHWLVCPTHVLWKFNRRPCEKPQCLRCTIAARRPPQLWRMGSLLERASRHVDQFVAPSRFAARMHAERGFAPPMACLPLFVDRVDHEWQAPGPRPHEPPYFLFVGRLEPVKGLQALIEFWNQRPHADLLVVGTGTDESRLRRQAAGNPRIRFLGALAPSALGPLYAHAVACIVPSAGYETFGLVAVESFARRTPVIARDLGALPELIDESRGGYVYRTDEQLAEAIDRLVASPALRAELGANGYATFLRAWTKDAHLERYFDILRAAAARKLGHVPWGRA